MRIGYFGGSFDPPHRGHLTVARAARDRFALDRILLAPTARQPFKPEGPVASYTDRLRMTELLCKGELGLEASPVDGPQPRNAPNYTVDTLGRLRAELPDGARVFAILGADAFLSFPQWREANELRRMAEWIVVSRPGSALPGTDASEVVVIDAEGPGHRAELGGHVHLLADIYDPVSATELRQRLTAGQDCEGLLPTSVREYIEEHRLYRLADPA